jgi:hypothetical protein
LDNLADSTSEARLEAIAADAADSIFHNFPTLIYQRWRMLQWLWVGVLSSRRKLEIFLSVDF